MTWPEGIEAIKQLIEGRKLERVPPNLDGANAFLDAASLHLSSALVIAENDPEGAYTMVYDAARKSLAALLLTQGLRPTTTGGHYAIQQAISAQFTEPPPRDAFRPFARIRPTRHQAEYEHVRSLDVDLVRADHDLVTTLHQVAGTLVPVLTVFSA